MKIVINDSYGGFGVSKDFLEYYNIPYKKFLGFCDTEQDISRTDKRLIEFIEKFGSERASGRVSNLIVKEIPNGQRYRIEEYDGKETIIFPEDEQWEIAKENE